MLAHQNLLPLVIMSKVLVIIVIINYLIYYKQITVVMTDINTAVTQVD